MRFLKEKIHRFILDGFFSYHWGNDNGRSIDAFGILAKIGYRFESIPVRPDGWLALQVQFTL